MRAPARSHARTKRNNFPVTNSEKHGEQQWKKIMKTVTNIEKLLKHSENSDNNEKLRKHWKKKQLKQFEQLKQ